MLSDGGQRYFGGNDCTHWAAGASLQNLSTCKCERVSASMLSLVWIYLDFNLKFFFICLKTRILTSAMDLTHGVVCLFTMATADLLSHQTLMHFLVKSSDQVVTASVSAYNSSHATCVFQWTSQAIACWAIFLWSMYPIPLNCCGQHWLRRITQSCHVLWCSRRGCPYYHFLRRHATFSSPFSTHPWHLCGNGMAMTFAHHTNAW